MAKRVRMHIRGGEMDSSIENRPSPVFRKAGRKVSGRLTHPVPFFIRHLLAAHLPFLLLDHALDHVAADISGLAGRQIALVTLFRVNT